MTKKTRAIIVQYTFGYPAEIDRILEIARERTIFVIEDSTHTIGAERDGKLLGTCGDAAIFSLGRDKAISGSFGGVVITSREDFGMKLESQQLQLGYPSNVWIARQLLYTIGGYLTRRYYQTFSVGKLIHFLLAKTHLVQLPTSGEENQLSAIPPHAMKKLPNALALVAFNQLNKLDQLNEKRHTITNLYAHELKRLELSAISLPSWELTQNLFPVRYPLIVQRRDQLRAFAKSRGVMLGNWYEVPVAPRNVNQTAAGYTLGSCPQAEKVCTQVINLPITPDMTKENALTIVKMIKEFYHNRKSS